MNIENLLIAYKKKTILEKDLFREHGLGYEEHVKIVKELVDNVRLEPVVASKLNGRRPSLYNKYRIVETSSTDYSSEREQIKLLHPYFNHQIYFDNPSIYSNNQFEINALSDYLWNHKNELERTMSINERSLKIWGKEKLLKEHYSKLCNIFSFKSWSLDKLNFYETPEPFFEYIHKRSEKMNILIVENKDTWYTLRKAMTEFDCNLFLDKEFNAILYGEGRKITRQSGRLEEYKDDMFAGDDIEFYYFGDLDNEGISIFQDLVKANKNISIKPFITAYELMIKLSHDCHLPGTKDKRVVKSGVCTFITYLSLESQKKLTEILVNGEYIPQEIINYQVVTDYMKK